jgi:hypothetical protein
MRREGRTDDPDGIAIRGLAFLAADAERLGRFLALTGLGPENLRAAAAAPGFLASVLAHLAQDESLLLAFAADAGLPPETIARAAARAAGPTPGEFDA